VLRGHKQIKKLWQRLASGIFVPNGYESNCSRSDSESYLQMKEKAEQLELLYKEVGVVIPDGSGLALLIESAKQLSDSWLINGAESVSDTVLFRAAHLNRVSDAILTLRSDTDTAFHLEKLTEGSLDLLERDQSVAKNFLWELELLHVLRVHDVEAELREPPDIVANFEGSSIGIACKKVYSEKNVEKVLSKGVSQIEQEYEFGILAVNIDDLVPAGSLLKAKTQQDMAENISALNLQFLRKHERHFRKYLETGRVLSALVSTSVLADVQNGDVRLNNARQSSVWMIPGLSEDKAAVFNNFYTKIMQ